MALTVSLIFNYLNFSTLPVHTLISAPFEFELPMDASLEDLKDYINDELGLTGDDNFYVRNGDESIFCNEGIEEDNDEDEDEVDHDQAISDDKRELYDKKVIEALEPEEDGEYLYHLDCELKQAGAKDMKFYVRNATREDLEIHVSYSKKVYGKDATKR